MNIQVAGRDAWMKIGTDTPYSSINWQLADSLKLRLHDSPGITVVDDASQRIKHMVEVPTLTVGDVKATDAPFLVEGENNPNPLPWDGTIGVNFLANYDVEVDPAHEKVTLFLHNHCNGQAAYWTRNFQALPFTMKMSKLSFTTTLDTHAISTSIDMTMPDTFLHPKQAASEPFNVDPGAPPQGEIVTTSGAMLPFYRHRFASLDIGGVGFRNTEIGIVSHKVRPKFAGEPTMNIDAVVHHRTTAPLSLGIHHLSHLRFMIAYGESLLYISAADAN